MFLFGKEMWEFPSPRVRYLLCSKKSKKGSLYPVQRKKSYELSDEHQREVIFGTTSFMTPNDYLDALCTLDDAATDVNSVQLDMNT